MSYSSVKDSHFFFDRLTEFSFPGLNLQSTAVRT